MRYVFFIFLTLFSTVSFSQIIPPVIEAKAWMLFDVNSRQVLASKCSDEKLEPASLTKLMSAYIVFDALKHGKIFLEQKVIPSSSILRVQKDESRSFITVHKPVSVNVLMHGMVTQSGNDATIALAELIAGDQASFVNMMNSKARNLGMKMTNYTNVNGMPNPNHYTTARDLLLLSQALLRDFPEFYSIFAEREFTHNNITQRNRNRLLWLDKTVDGLKTGYTVSAGYCLVATVKRPLLNVDGIDHRIIAVLMGSPSDDARTRDSLKLINYAYQSFKTSRICLKNKIITKIPVYKGKNSTVNAGTLLDQFITLPVHKIHSVNLSVTRKKWLFVPVKKGAKVGIVHINIDGKKIKEFPLVALEEVPLGGWFTRLRDFLFFKLSH